MSQIKELAERYADSRVLNVDLAGVDQSTVHEIWKLHAEEVLGFAVPEILAKLRSTAQELGATKETLNTLDTIFIVSGLETSQ